MQFEAFKWKSFHFCFDLYVSFIFGEWMLVPCLSSFCRQPTGEEEKRNTSEHPLVCMSRIVPCALQTSFFRYRLSFVPLLFFFFFLSPLQLSQVLPLHSWWVILAMPQPPDYHLKNTKKKKKEYGIHVCLSPVKCRNVSWQVCVDHVHSYEDILVNLDMPSVPTQTDRCFCWHEKEKTFYLSLIDESPLCKCAQCTHTHLHSHGQFQMFVNNATQQMKKKTWYTSPRLSWHEQRERGWVLGWREVEFIEIVFEHERNSKRVLK